MANSIILDVYEFGTGNLYERRYPKAFVRESIVSMEPASVYNYKNQHFTDVRSKVTATWAGVLKDYHVSETVATIKSRLDA